MSDINYDVLSKWQVEFKKGFSKPLILAFLANKPNYPYSLTREISARTRGQIVIAGSNIYPILKNLQDEGLIIGERSGSNPNETLGKSKGPTRTIYSITDSGRAFLDELDKSISEFVGIILPLIESGDVK